MLELISDRCSFLRYRIQKYKSFSRDKNIRALFDYQLNFLLQRNMKEYFDSVNFIVFIIYFP